MRQNAGWPSAVTPGLCLVRLVVTGVVWGAVSRSQSEDMISEPRDASKRVANDGQVEVLGVRSLRVFPGLAAPAGFSAQVPPCD